MGLELLTKEADLEGFAVLGCAGEFCLHGVGDQQSLSGFAIDFGRPSTATPAEGGTPNGEVSAIDDFEIYAAARGRSSGEGEREGAGAGNTEYSIVGGTHDDDFGFFHLLVLGKGGDIDQAEERESGEAEAAPRG